LKLLALLVISFSAVGSGRAVGEIHDYMILRLLYLNTSCGTLSLERIEAEAPTARFRATCKDKSGYPDGLTVLCTDPDDDRLCRVETPEKTFRHLDLLRR